MRRMGLLAIPLLVLAGCFGGSRPDYEGIQGDAVEAALPLLAQDHGSDDGHLEAALHNGSFNLEEVGYHNGVDESGDPDAIPPAGYYTELVVKGDYAYLARMSADGSYGGFVILDVRDVAHPIKIGEYRGQGLNDIEVNDDQTLAFLATQRGTIEQIAGGLAATQDPTSVLSRGIVVVDISDKTNPTLAGFLPMPYNGPHTLTYVNHPDGNQYLVACTYDLTRNTIPSSTAPSPIADYTVVPLTQRLFVYQIAANPVPGAPGAGLVLVNSFAIIEPAPAGRLFLPHDAAVEVRGNETLLHVAYFDKGVHILDFSTPAQPPLMELGTGYTEFAPSKLNAIHQVRPFAAPIDGHHVLAAEPEVISATDETGYITFLDTADPAHITKLGHWTLPGDLGVQGLEFSPHNLDTFDGKVALAHNHAGLWIIDVSDGRNLAEPKTVGWFMATPERESPVKMQPYFWGVFEENGYLFASDEATGLHILRYTGP
ncbi:MAG TPA: hypothetical protein VI796_04750 [Candidatus Thermoplasmatota archaeon]|nr:hypothetical protein [Candidatus Thermoplasmatota archaeon]